VKRLVAAVGLALAAGPAAVGAEDRRVLVVEGDSAPNVKVGDVLRFTQSGAAGRSEISATVEGDARLVSTTDIRRFKDGRPLIGAVTREFEVKAEKAGTAVVRITVKDLVGKTSRTKVYKLVIEE
jgi:hypothetical protein